MKPAQAATAAVPAPGSASPLAHTLARLRAGALDGVRRLHLPASAGERLHALPAEVFRLADTLEVLDISGHALRSLPADLPRLHRLKVIFGSGNPFDELPPVLGQCPALEMLGFRGCGLERVSGAALPPRLRWLTLTDNRLQALPDSLGQRPALEKLMLAGNRLRAVPASLVNCRQLALLRLAANPALEALPPGLLALPALAWVALAGTAMVPAPPAATPAPSQAFAEPTPAPGHVPTHAPIHWHTLRLGEVLGQGASGVVHAAEWWPQGAVGHAQAVAVKLFKGHITSDGLPGCEMSATLAASQHPHLLGALGPLVGHPQGQVGLVLPRVPAHYQPLAAPPSFDSCSRDVYPTGWRLPGGPALQLAADMARAVAHLHAGGVLHGDVYGHNILRAPDGVGPALLSDFGAATPLARLPPAWQRGLQALETRAWGLLLQELLAAAEGLTPAQRDTACAWAAAATQPEPSRRPHMAQLASWAQQAGITD